MKTTPTASPITALEFSKHALPLLGAFETNMTDTVFYKTVELPGLIASFAISQLDKSRMLRHKNLPAKTICHDCAGRKVWRQFGWIAELSARGWMILPDSV